MSKPAKIPYQILDLPQGSDEWLEERKKWVTASDMASIMGVPGCFRKRDAVLKEKVTGEAKEVSEYVQENIFDPGHAAEGPLREEAQKALGMEFQPAVVLNEKLRFMASLDNVNFEKGVIVEAKLSKSPKVLEPAKAGRAFEPYRIQIMHQMMTTGFREAYLFVMDSESGDCHLVPVPFCEETAEAIQVESKLFLKDVDSGKTNEISILDVRMDRLARLLAKEHDVLEEIAGPMELLKDVKEEIDTIKKIIAEEFPHNTIIGSGVVITKSKPVESLDKSAMQKAGIDLQPFTKFNKPAVRAKLME